MTYNEFFFQTEPRYNALFIDLVFALGIDAIEEKDAGFYVRSNESLKNLAFALEAFRQNLSKKEKKDIFLKTKLEKKPNKDWIENYKKSVKALQIGDFYIHSSWQKPRENLKNVQIDPALAFGSGHHESTHSCILLLQKYAKKGMRTLDVGCGSGILSIILAKMGCEIYGCDVDEVAILSAKSNAKLNGVKFKEIWLGSVNSAVNSGENLRENSALNSRENSAVNLGENLRENSTLNSSGNLAENFATLSLRGDLSPRRLERSGFAKHPTGCVAKNELRVRQHEAKSTSLNSAVNSALNSSENLAVNLSENLHENSALNLGENLRENSAANLRENSRENDGDKSTKFDLIVANLTFEVISAIQNELKNSLKNGGILVLSGILERHENEIKELFEKREIQANLSPNLGKNLTRENSSKNSTQENLLQENLSQKNSTQENLSKNLDKNSAQKKLNLTQKNSSKNLSPNLKAVNSANFTQRDKIKANEWLSFVYVKDEK